MGDASGEGIRRHADPAEHVVGDEHVVPHALEQQVTHVGEVGRIDLGDEAEAVGSGVHQDRRSLVMKYFACG